MLRILPFLLFFFFYILSCNELFPCLNTAYGKDFMAILTICQNTKKKTFKRLSSRDTLAAKSDNAHDRPFFGENSRNITALAEGTVTLKCTVKNKGNRTVRHCHDYWHDSTINHETNSNPRTEFRQVISWIRRKDMAILTSNTFVYTTDTRFSVIHIPDSNNWDLRVKPVSVKDAGVYECQVNCEPKINFPIHLDVISE